MSSEKDSFSWNSIDFGDSDYSLHVVNRRTVLLPRPRVDFKDLAQTDGAVSHGRTFGRRKFDYLCKVSASSESDRKAKTDAIVAELIQAQLIGLAPLVEGWRSSEVYGARLVSEVDADLYLTGATFPLRFVAPNPWSTATSETNESDPILGDTTYAIDINGRRRARQAVWTAKNGSTQSPGGVTLQNVATGQTCIWEGPLFANEWLRFITATGAVDRDDVSGGTSWTNVLSGVTGSIPTVMGGFSNTIKIFGLIDGTLLVDYYAEG